MLFPIDICPMEPGASEAGLILQRSMDSVAAVFALGSDWRFGLPLLRHLHKLYFLRKTRNIGGKNAKPKKEYYLSLRNDWVNKQIKLNLEDKNKTKQVRSHFLLPIQRGGGTLREGAGPTPKGEGPAT